MDYQVQIASGETFLGIELGSTRIKAVLIGTDHAPIASGDFSWENRYENGIWTYHTEDIWTGIQTAYANLTQDIQAKYGIPLKTCAAMGFSGMMHGYLPLDESGEPLVPFRTWRNTNTAQAAERLSQTFHFNIPQRWSIAHLYQAMLNGEPHVKDIKKLTTLAGYVHLKLTGVHALGIGEASGMFPIDSNTGTYDRTMMDCFDGFAAEYPWTLKWILPAVLRAGESAGVLTEEGARRLDPTGTLQAGIPLCPPEGDAGTGMTATNAVAARTGNVSAGTSVFAMVVLEQALRKYYPEIDMVTTPAGKPVAMVHCNNCTNEINAWATVFQGFLQALGQTPDKDQVYTAMFQAAAAGAPDAGGLVLYNYLSGEPITGFADGRPLLVRTPEADLTFPNLMRAQLYAAVATLKLGMDLLAQENVQLDRMMGHGGYFKTPVIGQRMMAAAVGAPVSVMETAGEGGPWGMALLAAYMMEKAADQTLEDYLDSRVFVGQRMSTIIPAAEDVEGFHRFLDGYRNGFAIQRAACESL